MKDPFAWFWIVMILLSVIWYGFFLFLVGIKGGREIIKMTENLSSLRENEKNHVEHD